MRLRDLSLISFSVRDRGHRGKCFAFGIIGFLAGLLFRGKREKYKKSKLILCLYGGIATLVIYGFLMDTSSITMFGTGFSWKALAAMYASGLPFNYRAWDFHNGVPVLSGGTDGTKIRAHQEKIWNL